MQKMLIIWERSPEKQDKKILITWILIFWKQYFVKYQRYSACRHDSSGHWNVSENVLKKSATFEEVSFEIHSYFFYEFKCWTKCLVWSWKVYKLVCPGLCPKGLRMVANVYKLTETGHIAQKIDCVLLNCFSCCVYWCTFCSSCFCTHVLQFMICNKISLNPNTAHSVFKMNKYYHSTQFSICLCGNFI